MMAGDPSQDHPPDGVTNAHVNSDVDDGPEAQHHTLGVAPEQAAAGNHTHKVRLVPALPVANAAVQGRTYILGGIPGVADIYYVCLKSVTDTYSWKVLATG